MTLEGIQLNKMVRVPCVGAEPVGLQEQYPVLTRCHTVRWPAHLSQQSCEGRAGLSTSALGLGAAKVWAPLVYRGRGPVS